MSTGQKFRFEGLSAGDRILMLRKKRELLALELVGHKEVVTQLLKVMDVAALTPEQARAVSEEIAWRRSTIADARCSRKHIKDSISHMKVAQARVQQRMRYAARDNERKAA